MANASFEYHGGPVFVVALQQTVEDGWTGKGPEALRHSAGFTETKPPKGKAAEPDADGGDS